MALQTAARCQSLPRLLSPADLLLQKAQEACYSKDRRLSLLRRRKYQMLLVSSQTVMYPSRPKFVVCHYILLSLQYSLCWYSSVSHSPKLI